MSSRSMHCHSSRLWYAGEVDDRGTDGCVVDDEIEPLVEFDLTGPRAVVLYWPRASVALSQANRWMVGLLIRLLRTSTMNARIMRPTEAKSSVS
jgi:hypothetical protein